MDNIRFMRENGIAVFAEADRTVGAVRIEKLWGPANWDLFQQLVLYPDADTLCDSTGSPFSFQLLIPGLQPCFSTVN